MNTKELSEKLGQISRMLETGKELIQEDPILEFQSAVKDIAVKLEDIMQEGRKLRLGIVGEVKAGKSSFLNAMLFEGKDILPKAPTPMTAALTRISYSDIPTAKIVFYSKKDWDDVVTMSRRYDDEMKKLYEEYTASVQKSGKESMKRRMENGNAQKKVIESYEDFEKRNRDRIPMDYRACKEVWSLSVENDLNVDEYLGKEKIIEGTSEDEYGYLKKLNEYVGAEGRYTSIVKYTEIQLCNKMLEGIEVIDTPGLNDPILSRSRTTKNFLIECDAVFLLGYCGQFLGADDMGFIMSSLPNEGIKKAILIGSKMDSAILQYPSKNNPSFKKAYLGTKRNCEEQARDNISSCLISEHNEKLLSQIKDSLPPKCISSLAYSAALQMQSGKPLGAMEKNMVDNLCRRFPDFVNSVETLYGLSNILDVKETVFEETKRNKEKIMRERMEDIVQSQIIRFQRALEDIAIRARSNQSDLKKYDCDQLEEKLNQIKENLDSIRIVVKNLFEKAAVESRRTMEEMAVDIGMEMGNHQDIEVAQNTRTEHHSSTSGILFWKKTTHWDEIITTHTAEVSDVDENLRKYLLSCQQIINSNFRNLLKIDKLQDDVKQTVMRVFDRTDREFDENRILVPLDAALARITLPNFEMSLEPYEAMLDESLGGIVSSGVVKNDNIPLLKRTQDKILAKISEDIVKIIRTQGKEIDSNLQKQAAVFVDSIVDQLEDNQKRIEVMIQDKQASLDKFDAFLSAVSNAKKTLLELGE